MPKVVSPANYLDFALVFTPSVRLLHVFNLLRDLVAIYGSSSCWASFFLSFRGVDNCCLVMISAGGGGGGGGLVGIWVELKISILSLFF